MVLVPSFVWCLLFETDKKKAGLLIVAVTGELKRLFTCLIRVCRVYCFCRYRTDTSSRRSLSGFRSAKNSRFCDAWRLPENDAGSSCSLTVSGEKDERILLRELFDDRLLRGLRRLGGAVAAESGETLQQPIRAVRYRSEADWLDDAFCRSSGNWT
jgi:hypothetical protein